MPPSHALSSSERAAASGPWAVTAPVHPSCWAIAGLGGREQSGAWCECSAASRPKELPLLADVVWPPDEAAVVLLVRRFLGLYAGKQKTRALQFARVSVKSM